jgi:hypothetical protein
MSVWRPSVVRDSVSSARMGVPSQEPSLSKEQRQALALLASIPYGVTEGQLVLAHGFDRSMIAGLVNEGLAIAQREVRYGSWPRGVIEVVRIRITDVGGARRITKS